MVNLWAVKITEAKAVGIYEISGDRISDSINSDHYHNNWVSRSMSYYVLGNIRFYDVTVEDISKLLKKHTSEKIGWGLCGVR